FFSLFPLFAIVVVCHIFTARMTSRNSPPGSAELACFTGGRRVTDLSRLASGPGELAIQPAGRTLPVLLHP
ncbi:MAG TPA: hypothetical protein VER98_07855, partial [Terriglobia bacterium]|nr:hypothetical protein [Terriglobia bacterium]